MAPFKSHKIRVVIPTTLGPVDVQLLTEEESSIGRSVVCIDGTTELADIDPQYHSFVIRPTGVVHRLFGHDCFRLDISARIDQGASWQLGVLLSHGLFAGQSLAIESDAADCVVWATGTVRTVDLSVGAVSHVPEKLQASVARLEREASAGRRVLILLPMANMADLTSEHRAWIERHGIELHAIEFADALWQRLALTPPPGQRPNLRSPGDRPRSDNLPYQVTSFIGRENEISGIEARLQRFRLVTLVGTGGVGKTRTTLQVAEALRAQFEDGVWFIELAPLDSATLVAETMCSIIGIPVQGNRSALDTAVDTLRNRRALIIFDNCEHLLRPVAGIIATLLRQCSGLSLLATSREALGVAGEGIFDLPTLACPDADERDVEQIRTYPSVHLFLERASALIDGFQLTADNAVAIATICRQLDGIPLAIELAVPRLRMMRPQGLADRLKDIFAGLPGSRQAELPRHQTLRLTIGWSYDLLKVKEQALLRRLAAFAGDWTLDAAVAVTSGDPLDARDIADLVTSLHDKSLITPDLTRAVPRYRLLETTRQFAMAKALDENEPDRRRRIAVYMLDVYTKSTATWQTMPTADWLGEYGGDLDNLRSSLEWAFESDGDRILGTALVSTTQRIWDELALLTERVRWFGIAGEDVPPDTPQDVLARLWLGRTSTSAHGDPRGFAPARHAAEHFRRIGDTLGLGEAIAKQGAARLRPTTAAEAQTYFEQALALLKPLGPTKALANCLRSMGLAKGFANEFERSRQYLEDSRSVAQVIGDVRAEVAVEIALAELEFAAGRPEVAIEITRKMLSSGRHNRRQQALGLGNLTSYYAATDRLLDARTVAVEGTKLAHALGWSGAVARMIEHSALIVSLGGDHDRAARLIGFSAAYYATDAGSREQTELASYDRLVDRLERALPLDRIEDLMIEGSAMSEERAVAVALTGLSDNLPS